MFVNYECENSIRLNLAYQIYFSSYIISLLPSYKPCVPDNRRPIHVFFEFVYLYHSLIQIYDQPSHSVHRSLRIMKYIVYNQGVLSRPKSQYYRIGSFSHKSLDDWRLFKHTSYQQGFECTLMMRDSHRFHSIEMIEHHLIMSIQSSIEMIDV